MITDANLSSARNYLGQTFQYHSGDIILFESDYSVRNDFHKENKAIAIRSFPDWVAMRK